MTTYSQRALILYRCRRFINHLLTYLLTYLPSSSKPAFVFKCILKVCWWQVDLSPCSTTCFYVTVLPVPFVIQACISCTFTCANQVCRHYPGFLRVFLQDPQPDRRFMRRGWLTFDHTVNIKEICWNLNNIRVMTLLQHNDSVVLSVIDYTSRIWQKLRYC